MASISAFRGATARVPCTFDDHDAHGTITLRVHDPPGCRCAVQRTSLHLNRAQWRSDTLKYTRAQRAARASQERAEPVSSVD